MSLEFMRNFMLIRDEKQQEALSQMARSLVRQTVPEEAAETPREFGKDGFVGDR